MIFELAVKPIDERVNVFDLEPKQVGNVLIKKLREDLKMPNLDLQKIEGSIEGGSEVSYKIYLPEILALKCPLFNDTNKIEVIITDLGLNQYIGIGYEIWYGDKFICIRPDKKTHKVDDALINDAGLTCEQISKIKFRYILYEEEFIDDWEQMGFPKVFQIKKESEEQDLMKSISPKQFYRDLYHYIDGDICNGEIRYFNFKEELINLLKEEEGFGVVNFPETFFSEDEEGFDPEIDTAYDIESFFIWKGPGDYVAWSWGDEHIECIDDAYEALMEEYANGDFDPPSNKEVNEMYNKLYNKGNNK